MDMERSKVPVAPRGAAPLPGDQGKEDILGRSPFAGLAGESRRALLALGTVQRLPRRHCIVAEGEPPRSLLLLGAGRVKLERASGERGERAMPLGHRGPGQMVGETALAGAPSAGVPSATESATVVDDVEAVTFAIAALRDRLAEDGALRAIMAAAILRQHRAAEQRLEGLLLYGVEARLVSLLVDAAGRWGAPHAEGTLLTAPFTHAELALLIGSTRETVTLVLGKLKREGLVAFDRRRIILRDAEELAARLAHPEPPPRGA
jgi:CRP-like cAMP-binding protein